MFASPLQIGKLNVSNRALLSPLAGVSDVPFRRICTELGAGLCYVEMLSATAINHKNAPTAHMLARHESESKLGVQVTGPTAEETARAAVTLAREGFETIDINMGCPVRKIVGKGWGAAILQDPQRVEDTVRACVESVPVPVTAKIRLGFTRSTLNVEEVSECITRAGAEMLTIHGRCRSEDYTREVDYESIAAGFASARAQREESPPVFLGNGNVFDIRSAERMMRSTGSDGVLVSRGALGNPWIFRQLVENNPQHPTVGEWLEVVLRHVEYHETHFGASELTAIRFRKHLLWYVTGFYGSRKFRGSMSSVKTIPEIRERLIEFAATLHPEVRRYHKDPHRAERKDPKYEMDRKHDRGVGAEG